MAKHTPTPGPWILEADPTRRCPPFIRASGSASPLMQATACNDADLPNLRLAAAAPDLLNALGAISDALAAGDIVHIEPGSVQAVRLQKVVAKAVGKL